MLINESIGNFTKDVRERLANDFGAVHTSKVVLIPYSKHHVPTYHEWMKDPELQQATASEPLSLDQEYEMQETWRKDCDKLTFISCLPFAPQESKASAASPLEKELEQIFGDVNLFLYLEDDEGSEDTNAKLLVGELELMVARKELQGKGLGKASVLAFMLWIFEHENSVISEFLAAQDKGAGVASKLAYLRVRIHESNNRSISLFKALGFSLVGDGAPNYFGEIELRMYTTEKSVEDIRDLLASAGINDHTSLPYSIPIAGSSK